MIGILGSGLDSLILTQAVLENMPGINVFCLNDNLHFSAAAVCYPDRVIRKAVEHAGLLVEKGAGLILTASHTLSTIAGPALSSCGTPVLDIITPSIQQALAVSQQHQFGVIGSRRVMESDIYPEKIRKTDQNARIYCAACPLLAPLVEEGWIKKPVTAMIIKRYLLPLKIRQIDTLILASTLYTPIFQVIQRKIGKQVHVIDGTHELAKAAAAYLKTNPGVDSQMHRTGNLQVMLTAPSPQLITAAKTRLKVREIEVILMAA